MHGDHPIAHLVCDLKTLEKTGKQIIFQIQSNDNN